VLPSIINENAKSMLLYFNGTTDFVQLLLELIECGSGFESFLEHLVCGGITLNY
jgi:hypothetical protein